MSEMNTTNTSDLSLHGLARQRRPGMAGDDTLRDIEAKAEQSRSTFSQLKKSLANRPDLQPQIQDLEGKFQQRDQLLGKLRYSMEFRHELKRMGLNQNQVSALIPSRDTPFGQSPAFVVGLKDAAGGQHLFLRPIRVRR